MIPGIQVSSFKPILTTPEQVHEAFRRMAQMGCSTVQLQWIDPAVSIEYISASLKEYGIHSVSVQDLYETIRENKDYYIRLNQETGGAWMCISRIPARFRSIDGLNAYIAELREFQKELDAYGQKLCFHPVAADYEPIDGIDPVRYLLENMPELHLCLDLYHINKRGFSMTQWISEYAARIPMLHFKDEKDGKLVPCGQGNTNWTGVVDACAKHGIPYAFVEQETWDKDPFLSLHEAFDWLCAQL